MATVATQTPQDPAQLALDRWKADERSKSEAESDAFVQDAIRQLSDSSLVSQFEANVKQSGTWANEVDSSFARVMNNFVDIVNRYGRDFLALGGFLNEWRGLNQQWIQHLLLSRDVAAEHSAILRRFDRVFLDMVLHIQTDQDRLDVIVELEEFIVRLFFHHPEPTTTDTLVHDRQNEEHDNSHKMSRAFLELKRDIRNFVQRLDRYIDEQGTALLDAAKALRTQIEALTTEISALDEQINSARLALAISGGLLNVIGMITAGSLLATYQNRRNERDNERTQRQNELNEVNRRQAALAFLKIDVANLQPDIDLICERLFLFAEIWSSVRTQSIQFRSHIQGGMDAVTNMRFRREVQLAQDVCAPLVRGLELYSAELGGRLVQKGVLTVEQLKEDTRAQAQSAGEIKRRSETRTDPAEPVARAQGGDQAQGQKGDQAPVQKDGSKTREQVQPAQLERVPEMQARN
ncbi:hypothetical protein D9611_009382 [Ephemerocybe angulata]|uniref:Uncharacterized protein n=1 Tax=Ephemerocybe angulata TaxID=980116 RepID=A0A8H5BH11_9AGAR|nr:hypothetical protein D9611_009382 [Tulosesus angulatus]